MKSKAEIIRHHLAGLTVLDIGGIGYGEPNLYEKELLDAWPLCKKRICVDYSEKADISVDLNLLPLPKLDILPDIAIAFDVLEHLEHPTDVLRWIPCDRLIVTIPNALAPYLRWMEKRLASKHLFSFTPYTSTILLNESGWIVKEIDFQLGKWSPWLKLAHVIGSLCPSRVGTSIILYCERGTQKTWKYR